MTPAASLDPAERLARLRLIRSENVGPIVYGQLMEHYGTAVAALERLPELARRGGRRRELKIAGTAEAEAELAAIERLGARLLTLGEPDYPPALAEIPDPPPVISVLGNTELLARPAVAIVGARNASANGRHLAQQMAAGLAVEGLAVISGLARGIDAAAHLGALAETEGGGTLAVLAGGVDQIYPPENEALYRRIAEAGALVSEMPPGLVAQARHFPRRNRLIAGLSRAVVVVEAALRSGSLITARLALEQGREVMAVPGSPLDPRCRGSNRLIREGAALIESAEDVLELIAGQLREDRPPAGFASARPAQAERQPSLPELFPEPPTSGEAQGGKAALDAVAELLGPDPVAVDEVIRRCHLSPARVATALLELELAGRIERRTGNRVALVAAPGV